MNPLNRHFFHTVVRTQHLAMTLVGALCMSTALWAEDTVAAAPLSAAPQDNSVRTELSVVRPIHARDFRPLVTFGVTVGVQTFGVLVATAIAGPAYKFSDKSLLVGWGVVAGVAPAVGGTLDWTVGRMSKAYTSPLSAMILGAYSGAALGFLATYFTVQKDDPEVDGRYDPIYFGRNDAANALLNIAAYGLAPILLPAAGAAIAHLVMRRPLEGDRHVSFGPPSLWLQRSPSKAGALDVGAAFIRGSF